MTRRRSSEVEVVGVGSRWRGDDAAGLLVADRLAALRSPRVRVTALDGEPVSLLDAWEGAGAAVVVDAVRSGSAPGTVHRVEAGAARLPRRLAGPSTHALGVADAIELARALGRLPPKLVVYGIEGRGFELAAAVSEPVETGIRETAIAVAAEVERLLRSPRGPS